MLMCYARAHSSRHQSQGVTDPERRRIGLWRGDPSLSKMPHIIQGDDNPVSWNPNSSTIRIKVLPWIIIRTKEKDRPSLFP